MIIVDAVIVCQEEIGRFDVFFFFLLIYAMKLRLYQHRNSYRRTLNHFVIFPAVIELTLQQNMIELNRQTRRQSPQIF